MALSVYPQIWSLTRNSRFGQNHINSKYILIKSADFVQKNINSKKLSKSKHSLWGHTRSSQSLTGVPSVLASILSTHNKRTWWIRDLDLHEKGSHDINNAFNSAYMYGSFVYICKIWKRKVNFCQRKMHLSISSHHVQNAWNDTSNSCSRHILFSVNLTN